MLTLSKKRTHRYALALLTAVMAALAFGARAKYLNICSLTPRHAREMVLREDLYTLRSSIDQFTLEKDRAPQSLDDLIHAGYMKFLPTDPFTLKTDWVTMREDVSLIADQTRSGISDVHSNSSKTGLDGTAYNTW